MFEGRGDDAVGVGQLDREGLALQPGEQLEAPAEGLPSGLLVDALHAMVTFGARRPTRPCASGRWWPRR